MRRSLTEVIIDVRDALVAPVRFSQFIGVGLVGAVLDLTVSWALFFSGLLSPEWAKVVGAECAIVLMFLINDRWTFAAHGRAGWVAKLRRLVKSNLVRSTGLAVQFAIVYVLVRMDVDLVVAGADLWSALTMPIAIAAAGLVNYSAETLLTWRVQDAR